MDLTPREQQVFDLICEGLANKEIAWRLHMSIHTVKKYVGLIEKKRGFAPRGRVEMIVAYWKQMLVNAGEA
jgi:DNA-binding CsgD family transcriptional regulator